MSKLPLTFSELPAVTSVLPHRPPFLMVDRVVELREGHLTSLRTFRADEPFFSGHFPGHPVVPGVLLVEGLAQTMAYYALFHQSAPRVLLVGMDRVRFRSVVETGMEVTFEVEVGEQRFGLLAGRGRVRVGTRKVAEATLKGFAGKPGRALG
jgi:3-hydroxyacyl-[acyl-carrier-protein] dehydratase